MQRDGGLDARLALARGEDVAPPLGNLEDTGHSGRSRRSCCAARAGATAAPRPKSAPPRYRCTRTRASPSGRARPPPRRGRRWVPRCGARAAAARRACGPPAQAPSASLRTCSPVTSARSSRSSSLVIQCSRQQSVSRHAHGSRASGGRAPASSLIQNVRKPVSLPAVLLDSYI